MTQLLQNAAYGTALILAAALLRRALRERLLPGARLALWGVCLFRLLTPAAPESVFSLWGLFKPRRQAAPAPIPEVLPAAGAPAPAPEPGIPWETALLALWLAVGALLALRYALAWGRTRRAVACAIPLDRGDPRYLPLPKCARLREGPMEGAPLTFGAVRPTVVLSPGLEGEELACVLAHEGVHAARRDNLWHYAMALALAVHWWNPAVWLMSRLLRRDIELSCDRAAVKKLGAGKRADYARALVALSTQAEGPAFCQSFGRKATEERIRAVMKFKKISIIGAIFTLALVLAVTVGFASNPAEKKTSGELLDKPVLAESAMQNEDGTVTEYTVNLDVLKQNLDRHVAEGTMTQAEADRVWEQAQEFAQGGKALTWAFQGDSGLTLDELHNVCYRDENGKLIPVDPATVVGAFVFPDMPTYVEEPADPDKADSLLGDLLGEGDIQYDLKDYNVKLPTFDEDGSSVSADGGSTGTRRYTLCGADDCAVSGAHYHLNGKVIGVDYQDPYTGSTQPPSTIRSPIAYCDADDCAVSGAHYHENGEVIMMAVPSAEPIACPPDVIDQSLPSRTNCYPSESGHHSETHHTSGHH